MISVSRIFLLHYIFHFKHNTLTKLAGNAGAFHDFAFNPKYYLFKNSQRISLNSLFYIWYCRVLKSSKLFMGRTLELVFKISHLKSAVCLNISDFYSVAEFFLNTFKKLFERQRCTESEKENVSKWWTRLSCTSSFPGRPQLSRIVRGWHSKPDTASMSPQTCRELEDVGETYHFKYSYFDLKVWLVKICTF